MEEPSRKILSVPLATVPPRRQDPPGRGAVIVPVHSAVTGAPTEAWPPKGEPGHEKLMAGSSRWPIGAPPLE